MMRAALIFACFLIACAHECGQNGELCAQTSNHLVVIDAGSTGTRAHVYHYRQRVVTAANYPLVQLPPLSFPQELVVFKARPGLSSFLYDEAGLNQSLASLFRAAADGLLLHAPHVDLKRVPVYLGATAGLRLFNQEERAQVMKFVIQFCRGADNPFSFMRDDQARVLAGEEEGAFGWLALNSLRSTIAADFNKTFGALDMGGASTQISFIPREPSILAGVFPMHFGQSLGGPVHLYSHSYLRFGVTAAFQVATKTLMPGLNAAAVQEFEHPCLPPGVTWHVNPDEFGVSLVSPNVSRTAGPLVMRGAGSYHGCRALAKKLMPKTVCFQPPCSFAGVYQPLLNDSKFVVFGELEEFQSWGVAPWIQEGMPLLAALEKQMKRICSLPSATQVELFGDTKLPACWKGVWLFTLLTDGMNFPVESKSLEILQGCCDVAQGRAIYEINYFPYAVKPFNTTNASILDDGGINAKTVITVSPVVAAELKAARVNRPQELLVAVGVLLASQPVLLWCAFQAGRRRGGVHFTQPLLEKS
eukprot:TRINITY_DN49_c0_g2_i1.p1 TRINITY_DN49_c0_g2~~TRINITY_DN49_c0_g2_i1.p1  ORF type:complete len:531 (+),score=92.19 TRINITY_DN49_c0_g2_i1:40-1632(+)